MNKGYIFPEKNLPSSTRAVIAVCSDVESARIAMIKAKGRRPRCYQRNIHAEDCDVYVHVVVCDIEKPEKKGR